MNIKVIKEGKDENQGVGYLDDGTMVVIDNGKKHINKDVNLIITSVIQTPTGRMIFSKVADLRDKDNSISGAIKVWQKCIIKILASGGSGLRFGSTKIT